MMSGRSRRAMALVLWAVAVAASIVTAISAADADDRVTAVSLVVGAWATVAALVATAILVDGRGD